MNPIFKKVFKGKILFIENDLLFYYNKGKIFKSIDGGVTSYVYLNLLSKSNSNKILLEFNLLERLLRKGVHHLNFDSKNCYILFNKEVVVTSESGDIISVESFRGSRPLSFEIFNRKLFFGEYRPNPERSEIFIYQKDFNKKLNFDKHISGVRHIHGIYKDPYSNDVYITTGDEDDESILFKTNIAFDYFHVVLSGSQQTRMIKLLFDEQYIYFGSDAPNELNHLYKLNKKTNDLTKLIQVGSSVFHGCKVGNWFFFSTAIEPSTINKTKYSELWASPDGNNWKCISKFKKDIFPMKYFQYGQLFFPNGNGDTKNLWFSPFSTKSNNYTIRVDLVDISNLFYSLN